MASTLAPDVESELISRWPVLPHDARYLLRRVLSNFLPANAALLTRLDQIDAADLPASDEPEQADLIQQRLAILSLTAPLPPPRPDAWRALIGAFGDDPGLAKMWEEGRKIREAERHSGISVSRT